MEAERFYLSDFDLLLEEMDSLIEAKDQPSDSEIAHLLTNIVQLMEDLSDYFEITPFVEQNVKVELILRQLWSSLYIAHEQLLKLYVQTNN